MCRKPEPPQPLSVYEIAIVIDLEACRRHGGDTEKYKVAERVANRMQSSRGVIQALFDRLVAAGYVMRMNDGYVATDHGMLAFRHTVSILGEVGFRNIMV